jgi:hypothetical protein
MPTTRFEDPPWYPRVKEAIERVVAAQMKRDSAESGTAEREAIEREYEAALAAFRSIEAQVKKDGPTPAAGVGFFLFWASHSKTYATDNHHRHTVGGFRPR